MNSEYVSEALNGLDEAYITEAENAAVKRPARFKWIGAAAACLALVMGTAFFIKTQIGGKPGSYADLPKFTISNPYGDVAGPSQGNTVFDISEDAYPERTTANVYKVVRVNQNEEVLLNMARLLGAEDPKVEYNDKNVHPRMMLKTSDGNVKGSCNENWIQVYSKTVNPVPAKEKLYDDSEYVRIAREFLEKANLNLENAIPTEPYVAVDGLVNSDAEGNYEAFECVDVVYRPKEIDGIEYKWGDACFFCIEMTNEGEIMEARGRLFDFTEPLEYPLMTVGEVINLYEKDRDKLIVFKDCPENGLVATEVKLGYILVHEYRESMQDGESYEDTYMGSWLLPVYVFSGSWLQEGLFDDSFETVICAVSSDYVKFSYTPAC